MTEEKKKRFRAAAEALKPEIYTQTVRPQAVYVQEKEKWQERTPKAPAQTGAAVKQEEASAQADAAARLEVPAQPGTAAAAEPAENISTEKNVTAARKEEISAQAGAAAAASAAQGVPLRLNQPILFDFGNHFVGRISLKLTAEGYHQDAPVFLKLKFCESKKEIDEDTSNYQGWISKAWIQEEWFHVDVLPAAVEPDRRYAFRYIRIDLLAESDRFSTIVADICAETCTSARDADAQKLIGNSKEQALQRVSLRTLRSCMQDVFEDGPKRDRRLWIGDLRLQALANYASYQNNDLVKRCLYLFAGTCNADGRICACVFTEPETEGDETYMFDYSLFFIPTLLDYYKETGDRETALDLLETAYRQTEIAREYFDENNCMRDSDVLGWCFLDWNLALNKQACAQAVYIYCVRAMRELICLLLKESEVQDAGAKTGEQFLSDCGQQMLKILSDEIAGKTAAARKYFYDEEKGLFVSGAVRQVSYASQVWSVLADICPPRENVRIMKRIAAYEGAEGMVTPYMYHNYIDALLHCGLRREAYDAMIGYWGAMTDEGADTFYELFNPDNPDESPYGSNVVNSYCHAWSCTPVYFIRKRGLTEEKLC